MNRMPVGVVVVATYALVTALTAFGVMFGAGPGNDSFLLLLPWVFSLVVVSGCLSFLSGVLVYMLLIALGTASAAVGIGLLRRKPLALLGGIFYCLAWATVNAVCLVWFALYDDISFLTGYWDGLMFVLPLIASLGCTGYLVFSQDVKRTFQR